MDELSFSADRRWATRRQIGLDAHLTDTKGASYSVVIVNVSEDGCGILIQTGVELARELPHTLMARGVDPLTVYVIWSKDGQAGLALANPLHPMIVQRLVMKSLYGKISRRLSSDTRPN